MLLVDLLYLGENEFMEDEIQEFHEMQDVIKNDFIIFINYILINYENKDMLEKEMNKVYNEICFSIPYSCNWHREYVIKVDDEFVYFNYRVYHERKYEYEIYSAVVKRDYKEFYFIYPNNKIKRFIIDKNKVMYKPFKIHNKLNWTSKNNILKSIAYLNSIN